MTERVPFKRIGTNQATQLLRQSRPVILDVRDAESFANGHIDGAQNISILNLSDVIEATDKSKSILIYCYHGHASQEYAQIFCDFRFRNVYSLDGGYEGWRARDAMQRMSA